MLIHPPTLPLKLPSFAQSFPVLFWFLFFLIIRTPPPPNPFTQCVSDGNKVYPFLQGWNGQISGWIDGGDIETPVQRLSLQVSIERRLHCRLVAVKCSAGRHQTGLTGVFSNLTIVSEGLFFGLLSHYAVMVAIFCFGIWLFFFSGRK